MSVERKRLFLTDVPKVIGLVGESEAAFLISGEPGTACNLKRLCVLSLSLSSNCFFHNNVTAKTGSVNEAF